MPSFSCVHPEAAPDAEVPGSLGSAGGDGRGRPPIRSRSAPRPTAAPRRQAAGRSGANREPSSVPRRREAPRARRGPARPNASNPSRRARLDRRPFSPPFTYQ